MENSQKVMQKIKQLKDKAERYDRLVSEWEDAKTLVALAIEEDDDSLLDEIKNTYESVKETLDNMTLETLLSGKYDKCNAIMTFHAGAGGTEAQDWAQMLQRMYLRWADSHGFSVEELDFLPGRRSRDQEREPAYFRRERVWLPQRGARHPPPHPYFSL